jgi:mannosyltransferase OCH1-like enzyme
MSHNGLENKTQLFAMDHSFARRILHHKIFDSKMSKIPKLIWQTWKTHEVPEKWKRSPESIQMAMSNWKYTLYDDKENLEFVKEHFPEAVEAYNNFPYPIQRADFIRACRLYVDGGIYLDLDFYMRSSIDDLFEDGELFFVRSANFGCFTNAFMASKAKHPFWLDYIKQMQKSPNGWAVGKHMHVMKTTGPLRLTECINKSDHPYVVLPSSVLVPSSVCEIGSGDCPIPSSKSRLIPLEGGSWNSWDSKLLNFSLCKWREIIIVILFLLFVWLIWRKNKCLYR